MPDSEEQTNLLARETELRGLKDSLQKAEKEAKESKGKFESLQEALASKEKDFQSKLAQQDVSPNDFSTPQLPSFSIVIFLRLHA